MPYPQVMTHPGFVSATLADEEAGVSASPSVNPPVVVNDDSQEAQYRAKGYFLLGEIGSEYTYQEYPKWVGDKIVNSAAEEKALKKVAGKAAAEAQAAADQAAADEAEAKAKAEAEAANNG